MKKHVAIITTGGTIAMRHDPERGVVPAVSGNELAQAVPGLADAAQITVYEYANVPSGYITPAHMWELMLLVENILANPAIHGVVITHGTDTLEETAYFLDMTVQSNKPVVVTGAMRSAGEAGADGPQNLLAAVTTAAADAAMGLGTLVVLNDEIHAARDATKSHTANPGTFVSPWWGPLGYVDADRIIVHRRTPERKCIRPEQLGGEVYVLKLYAGCTSLLFDTLIEQNVAGIVLEAFGRGNIPPSLLACVARATQQGIVVVLASRCHAGRALDVYGYEGGAVTVCNAGAILAGELTGHKARLRLMLALGHTTDTATLKQMFAYA